jgi:hypothetical protein
MKYDRLIWQESYMTFMTTYIVFLKEKKRKKKKALSTLSTNYIWTKYFLFSLLQQ